jgi:hypothetical protein
VSGAQPGNVLALKHGVSSERQIRPVAASHRRRVLRQLRLRAGDIDPIGKAYLDSYVRLAAKIDLADLYVEKYGMIRPDGEPQPVMRLYVALQNSARLALARLEQHLRTSDPAASGLEALIVEGSAIRERRDLEDEDA